ncbi:hypothetical protein IMZ48_28630 [Candidatus Bathyarchaeota archaeon]|nr:hypothetical protein [Candidatus Bathyarchaeota archaeon]
MAECSAVSSKWMFLIHHVFLPPKLPQEDNASGQDQEHLAQQALKALRTFKAAYDDATLGKQATAIGAAAGAVSNLLRVHNFSSDESDATINSEDLQEALEDLVKTGMNRQYLLSS